MTYKPKPVSDELLDTLYSYSYSDARQMLAEDGSTWAFIISLITEVRTSRAQKLTGSWAWALEQMKAGKRVTHSSLTTWYIFIKRDQILTLAAGFEHAWVPFASEFERTDWEIVETKGNL